jgi:hypothetical protein
MPTSSGKDCGAAIARARESEEAENGHKHWVPGRGLRLQRAVLASGGSGELFVDTLKNKRARTVPLVADLIPIVDRWAGDKVHDAWLSTLLRAVR